MNKVWLRGTVTGKATHEVKNGVDMLLFSLFVKGAIPVPSAISKICNTPEYGNMIRICAKDELALQLWDIHEEDLYIHEMYGYIWTPKNGRTLSVNVLKLDLTDATTEEREYEPLNRCELSGFVSNEGWINEINGALEKKFMLTAPPGTWVTMNQSGSDYAARVKVKCYEELAEKTHIDFVKGTKVRQLVGPINTWGKTKKNNQGFPVRDYAVIAEKIDYK